MRRIPTMTALPLPPYARLAAAIAGTLLVSAGCETSASPSGPTAIAMPAHALAASETNTAVATIRIQHGSIVHINPELPLIDLRGSGGFRFDGFANPESNPTGTFFPDCSWVVGCPAGATLQFAADWAGSTLGGDLRLRGRLYESIGSLDPDAGVRIQLTGTVTLPQHTAATAVVTAPFQLTGEVVDLSISPGERYDLTGHGIVTFSLRWSDADQTWYVSSADFQLRPGPA
jgi:hypothetical protein